MRWSIIRTVFFKEVREMLRDRRSMLIMFGVPLVLYPVMLLGIGAIGQKKITTLKTEKNPVAIENAAAAPKLMELIHRPDSSISIDDQPDPEKRLHTGDVGAILVVPDHAEQRALAGEEVHFKVKVDRSREAASFVEGKIDRLLHDYETWIIQQRLAAHHLPADILQGLKTDTTDVASADQRLGHLMASVLPLFLLITGMLGAFFPALSVTTTEREHGTLETLLVTPAGRTELLLAKGALVLLSALLTAGLNMLSMSMVMWRMFSMLPDKVGGTLTISPSALALAYLAAVPTIIFFSAIVLVVGLLARTYREASSMATPVMLLPVISMVVGLAEPKISTAILLTPIVNTTVIIREALTGRVGLGPFAAAFAASCLYAGLLVSAAARLFSNEQLVNSNWEPLSLRGLTKLGSAPRRRLPGVDEVLALWAVTILLNFYVAPSLLDYPLLLIILIVQYGLLLAPTLLTATLAKWRFADTFNWHRPRAIHLLGALLMAPGLVVWVSFLYTLQNKLWHPDPNHVDPLAKLLADAVASHPYFVTLFVGITAGLCEELLYRGPIQTALLRRCPPRVAIFIAAALFSAAHLDLHGFPVRLLLGVILGYAAYRTRSILPAMLLHGVYDATGVAYLAWQVHHQGVATAVEQATTVQPFNTELLIELIVGAVLILIGSILLFRTRPVRKGSAGIGM